MANTRPSIEQTEDLDIHSILKKFRLIYERSILEYAKEYIETGEEALISHISLRVQFIPPTAIDAKELGQFISHLETVESRERRPLTTREAIIIGAAYECGVGVKKNAATDKTWYQKGGNTHNSLVSKEISDRDRGNALSNVCSLLTDQDPDKLKIAREAAALGSEFAYAHLGCALSSLNQKIEAISFLKKAESISFANGRLGFILKNKEDKKKYFGIAASLGDVMALGNLSDFYKDNPSLYTLQQYEYSLRIGNYDEPSVTNEIAVASKFLNTLSVKEPTLFQQLTDNSPLMYLQPQLEPAQLDDLICMKALSLTFIQVELMAKLNHQDLSNLILQFICLPEYLQHAEATKYSDHWKANPNASEAEISSFATEKRKLFGQTYNFHRPAVLLSDEAKIDENDMPDDTQAHDSEIDKNNLDSVIRMTF